MSEDWKVYRREARYFEAELKRIADATMCGADRLREFAAAALAYQRAKRKRAKAQQRKRPGPGDEAYHGF